MQTADNFTYKKVFYSIRGLMSAELATQEVMPELLITDLFAQVSEHECVESEGASFLPRDSSAVRPAKWFPLSQSSDRSSGPDVLHPGSHPFLNRRHLRRPAEGYPHPS